jgi:hypothetical protein
MSTSPIGNPARALFERLRAGEEELLAALRSENAENDYIDFKESDSRPGALRANKLGESDQANLAETLSGFYNTAGGVVVWGIRCRDGDDPYQRQCVPGLEDGPSLFAAMSRKIDEAVRPGISGVDFALVKLSSGRTALLMYVPPREGGLPVEAKPKSKRGYYFRTGASFSSIPPDILAGMMGATPPSRVVPIVEPTMDRGQLRLNLRVRNEGRGMAFHVYLIVDWLTEKQRGCPRLSVGHNQFTSYDMSVTARYALGGPDLRLPPSAQLTVGALDVPLEPQPLRLRFTAGAHHDLPRILEYSFPEEAVCAVADRAAALSTPRCGRSCWKAALPSCGAEPASTRRIKPREEAPPWGASTSWSSRAS